MFNTSKKTCVEAFSLYFFLDLLHFEATYDSESLKKQTYIPLPLNSKKAKKSLLLQCILILGNKHTVNMLQVQRPLKFFACLIMHRNLVANYFVINKSKDRSVYIQQAPQSLQNPSSCLRFKMTTFDMCSVLPAGLECLQRNTSCFLGSPQCEVPPFSISIMCVLQLINTIR